MKMIMFTAGLLLVSSQVNAATNATSTLEDIDVNIISGSASSFFTENLVSNINIRADGFSGGSFQDYVITQGVPQLINKNHSISLVGDVGGHVRLDDQITRTSAYSQAYDGQITASSIVFNTIEYKANSLLLISATSYLSGSNDLGGYWEAEGSILVNSTSLSNGIYLTNLYSAAAYTNSSLWDSYETKELSIYYYNTVDSTLLVEFGVKTFANAVPEPSMYAMLGLGIGLLGVAARRRKSA